MVLLHESGSNAVWRSADHGATWNNVPTVPASGAKILIEHPSDSHKVP